MSKNLYQDVLETAEQNLVKKRRRVDGESAAATESFQLEAPAECKDEGGGKRNAELDVAGTINILRRHMVNEKKSPKALKLFKELFLSKISDENAGDFYEGLEHFFLWLGTDNANIEILNSATGLMEAVLSQVQTFSSEQQFQIQTWMLLTQAKKDLSCDDSFLFSRVCTFVLNCFLDRSMFPSQVSAEEQPPDPETISDIAFNVKEEAIPHELRRQRIAAVFSCMRVAFKPYKRAAWAKQPVDTLFAEVSRKRLAMDEDQRDVADELTTMITMSQRKMTSSGTQQNIRTYNSTAHPLITKNTGVLR